MKIGPALLVAALASLPWALCAEEPSAPFFGVSDSRETPGQTGGEGYYRQKEKGWFWYEPDPEPVAEVPEQSPAPDPAPLRQTVQKPPQAQPMPLSSEWFRENLTRYRDRAVDDPSDQNVSNYLYLQRVMLDKAARFGEVSQKVVMGDPLLDENTLRPVSTFGANAMDERADKGMANAAKQLAEKAGLWFFYSSTCSFCVKEAGVLKGLSHAYGFKVLPIALDGLPLPGSPFPNFTADAGQARKLGVETTPALFLAKPGKDGEVIQLGQGLLAVDEIVKRAVVLAHQHGWLTDDDYNRTLKANPVWVGSDTLRTVSHQDAENTQLLVDKIKSSLRESQRQSRTDG